jgi:hypothetical protein
MRQQLACRTRIEVNGFFSFVLHDHRITAIGQWPELAVDIQDVSGTEPDEIRLWHWIIPWRLAGGHAPSVQQARFLLDLAENWQQHGREVFKRVRRESPAAYLKVCAMRARERGSGPPAVIYVPDALKRCPLCHTRCT